jgi:hypothetical protein
MHPPSVCSKGRRKTARRSDAVIWLVMLQLTHRVSGGSELYGVSQVYGIKRPWEASRGKEKLFSN